MPGSEDDEKKQENTGPAKVLAQIRKFIDKDFVVDVKPVKNSIVLYDVCPYDTALTIAKDLATSFPQDRFQQNTEVNAFRNIDTTWPQNLRDAVILQVVTYMMWKGSRRVKKDPVYAKRICAIWNTMSIQNLPPKAKDEGDGEKDKKKASPQQSTINLLFGLSHNVSVTIPSAKNDGTGTSYTVSPGKMLVIAANKNAIPIIVDPVPKLHPNLPPAVLIAVPSLAFYDDQKVVPAGKDQRGESNSSKPSKAPKPTKEKPEVVQSKNSVEHYIRYIRENIQKTYPVSAIPRYTYAEFKDQVQHTTFFKARDMAQQRKGEFIKYMRRDKDITEKWDRPVGIPDQPACTWLEKIAEVFVFIAAVLCPSDTDTEIASEEFVRHMLDLRVQLMCGSDANLAAFEVSFKSTFEKLFDRFIRFEHASDVHVQLFQCLQTQSVGLVAISKELSPAVAAWLEKKLRVLMPGLQQNVAKHLLLLLWVSCYMMKLLATNRGMDRQIKQDDFTTLLMKLTLPYSSLLSIVYWQAQYAVVSGTKLELTEKKDAEDAKTPSANTNVHRASSATKHDDNDGFVISETKVEEAPLLVTMNDDEERRASNANREDKKQKHKKRKHGSKYIEGEAEDEDGDYGEEGDEDDDEYESDFVVDDDEEEEEDDDDAESVSVDEFVAPISKEEKRELRRQKKMEKAHAKWQQLKNKDRKYRLKQRQKKKGFDKIPKIDIMAMRSDEEEELSSLSEGHEDDSDESSSSSSSSSGSDSSSGSSSSSDSSSKAKRKEKKKEKRRKKKLAKKEKRRQKKQQAKEQRKKEKASQHRVANNSPAEEVHHLLGLREVEIIPEKKIRLEPTPVEIPPQAPPPPVDLPNLEDDMFDVAMPEKSASTTKQNAAEMDFLDMLTEVKEPAAEVKPIPVSVSVQIPEPVKVKPVVTPMPMIVAETPSTPPPKPIPAPVAPKQPDVPPSNPEVDRVKQLEKMIEDMKRMQDEKLAELQKQLEAKKQKKEASAEKKNKKKKQAEQTDGNASNTDNVDAAAPPKPSTTPDESASVKPEQGTKRAGRKLTEEQKAARREKMKKTRELNAMLQNKEGEDKDGSSADNSDGENAQEKMISQAVDQEAAMPVPMEGVTTATTEEEVKPARKKPGPKPGSSKAKKEAAKETEKASPVKAVSAPVLQPPPPRPTEKKKAVGAAAIDYSSDDEYIDPVDPDSDDALNAVIRMPVDGNVVDSSFTSIMSSFTNVGTLIKEALIANDKSNKGQGLPVLEVLKSKTNQMLPFLDQLSKTRRSRRRNLVSNWHLLKGDGKRDGVQLNSYDLPARFVFSGITTDQLTLIVVTLPVPVVAAFETIYSRWIGREPNCEFKVCKVPSNDAALSAGLPGDYLYARAALPQGPTFVRTLFVSRGSYRMPVNADVTSDEPTSYPICRLGTFCYIQTDNGPAAIKKFSRAALDDFSSLLADVVYVLPNTNQHINDRIYKSFAHEINYLNRAMLNQHMPAYQFSIWRADIPADGFPSAK